MYFSACGAWQRGFGTGGEAWQCTFRAVARGSAVAEPYTSLSRGGEAWERTAAWQCAFRTEKLGSALLALAARLVDERQLSSCEKEEPFEPAWVNEG